MSAHSSENYVPMVNGNSRQSLLDDAGQRSLGDSRINGRFEFSSNPSSPTAPPPGKEAATAPGKDQPKTVPEKAEVGTAQIPRWKRLLDLACIWLTFPLWLTVIALVSTWILLASPGPLLYRQERIGYRGRRFMILKFRTMKINVETQTHEGYFELLMQTNCPMTKLDCRDPRLIRGGRILRALGFDELPQLFNVIRGEMSLVGPRPCTPHEFERYQPAQKERVNAPPGLTGYWQVNGKNKTTFSEMIAMDIFYGSHMSIWMDLAIMLKTAPAIAAQVFESLTRKTGAKISTILKDWRIGGRRVR
jgi:lipopolysaccharide/colanic/teichoic acid biosynthesis glycosyltransferase